MREFTRTLSGMAISVIELSDITGYTEDKINDELFRLDTTLDWGLENTTCRYNGSERNCICLSKSESIILVLSLMPEHLELISDRWREHEDIYKDEHLTVLQNEEFVDC